MRGGPPLFWHAMAPAMGCETVSRPANELVTAIK